MVKFDAEAFQYMKRDEFRVLQAIEQGMKNHRLVPTELIESIAGQQRGNCFRWIQNLHKHKLVHHDSIPYDGYKLTFPGYDFLAMRAFVSKGLMTGVGRQIGVGKESDVFEATNEAGDILVLKLHRLGRTCFRAVKNKRDYLGKRHKTNWLYMSRLSALREFAYMKVLDDNKFPTPKAIDVNRHGVLMSMCDGLPLYQVRSLRDASTAYNTCMELIARLAEHGLIHCDFNEFNLMMDDNEVITMIDFPQMISTEHPDAQDHFGRDVGCIKKWFKKKYHYESTRQPELDTTKVKRLDVEVQASGYIKDAKEVQTMLDSTSAAQEDDAAVSPAEDGAAVSPAEDDAHTTSQTGDIEANADPNEHSSDGDSDEKRARRPTPRRGKGRASGRGRGRRELTMKDIQDRVRNKAKKMQVRKKGKSVYKTAQKNKVKSQTRHDMKNNGMNW